MKKHQLFASKKLQVSKEAPYDLVQAFVRDNHIAIEHKGDGELSGLVFAAKDVFKVKGSTYGNGHPLWLQTNNPDDFTSTAIEILLESGSDLVGKTVCDELCFSISGENWHYGSPLNPHDSSRYTGGSSSGSAAATASGLVDFAIGSDCLGSVRVPASYCGVIGMRPSLGRVDNTGEAPYCKSMDVLGYVASNKSIFAKVSDVLLGNDDKIFQLKKLYTLDWAWDFLEDSARIKEFIYDNFNPTPIDLSKDTVNEWVKTFQYIQGFEVWESYRDFIENHKPILHRGPRERLAWASTISREDYQKGLQNREDIIKHIGNLLSDDGVMIIPTAASIAPRRDADLEAINRTRADSSALLCISPLTKTPQVTLPILEVEDMPFGISFIGPQDSDQALVKFALDYLEA